MSASGGSSGLTGEGGGSPNENSSNNTSGKLTLLLYSVF